MPTRAWPLALILVACGPHPAATPAVATPPGHASGVGSGPRVAVVSAERDAVQIFEVGDGAVPRLIASVPLDDVAQLAWPDADGPVRVLRQILEGDTSRWELGHIDGGGYTLDALPGTGAVVGLLTDADNQVWVDRCEHWGDDNPDEEGCLQHAFHPLAPGPAHARTTRAPKPAPRVDAVAPPTTTTLVVRPHDDQLFALECHTPAGVTTVSDDEIVAPPTWEWLSADPPIALAHLEVAGSGEGEILADMTDPYLVRDCAIDPDGGTVRRGPDGLWAQRIYLDAQAAWQLHSLGTSLGTLPADDLVFAGAGL
jgi:hypothetical protein